jgi:hypothetical protein
MQTIYITIERERENRSSREGSRYRIKVRAQPGGPSLLMSPLPRQSVASAKSEAEIVFGQLDWRETEGDVRSSAVLEME